MAPIRYRIHNSAAVTERFREILLEAERNGRLAEYLAAVRRLFHRLSLVPLDCGEGRGHLPHLDLPLRVEFERPLVVTYAVHEESRTVFIRNIRQAASHRS